MNIQTNLDFNKMFSYIFVIFWCYSIQIYRKTFCQSQDLYIYLYIFKSLFRGFEQSFKLKPIIIQEQQILVYSYMLHCNQVLVLHPHTQKHIVSKGIKIFFFTSWTSKVGVPPPPPNAQWFMPASQFSPFCFCENKSGFLHNGLPPITTLFLCVSSQRCHYRMHLRINEKKAFVTQVQNIRLVKRSQDQFLSVSVH